MVEVFKTNIRGSASAAVVAEHIRTFFPAYQINFDLDDCDHILRVSCDTGIHPESLIACVYHAGFVAEVLADELPEKIRHQEPAILK